MVKYVKSFKYNPSANYILKNINLKNVISMRLNHIFRVGEQGIVDTFEIIMSLGNIKITAEVSNGELLVSTTDDIDFTVEEEVMHIIDDVSIEGKEFIVIKAIGSMVIEPMFEAIRSDKSQIKLTHELSMNEDSRIICRFVMDFDHEGKRMIISSNQNSVHLMYELVTTR